MGTYIGPVHHWVIESDVVGIAWCSVQISIVLKTADKATKKIFTVRQNYPVQEGDILCY